MISPEEYQRIKESTGKIWMDVEGSVSAQPRKKRGKGPSPSKFIGPDGKRRTRSGSNRPWIVWMRFQSCHYCGKKPAGTIDHKIPKSKGGRTTQENCVPSCPECNGLKKDMSYGRFVFVIKNGLIDTLRDRGAGAIDFGELGI